MEVFSLVCNLLLLSLLRNHLSSGFASIESSSYLDIHFAQVGGTRVRVGGMAKGSGMIHPNMATMLGVCLLRDPITVSRVEVVIPI